MNRRDCRPQSLPTRHRGDRRRGFSEIVNDRQHDDNGGEQHHDAVGAAPLSDTVFTNTGRHYADRGEEERARPKLRSTMLAGGDDPEQRGRRRSLPRTRATVISGPPVMPSVTLPTPGIGSIRAEQDAQHHADAERDEGRTPAVALTVVAEVATHLFLSFGRYDQPTWSRGCISERRSPSRTTSMRRSAARAGIRSGKPLGSGNCGTCATLTTPALETNTRI